MNFQFSIFNFPENQKHWTKQISSGFTLIEMIIVVSMIVILTSIIVPIYQGTKKQLVLQGTTNKLAQDIRRAQEMAMAAREFQGSVPSGGYGIYLNLSTPDHYILFADLDSGYDYDTGELLEDITFENKIEIGQLFPSSPLTITFTPPDPTTWVKWGLNLSSSTTAAIILKIDNSTTSVKVLPTGLIFVE